VLDTPTSRHASLVLPSWVARCSRRWRPCVMMSSGVTVSGSFGSMEGATGSITVPHPSVGTCQLDTRTGTSRVRPDGSGAGQGSHDHGGVAVGTRTVGRVAQVVLAAGVVVALSG